MQILYSALKNGSESLTDENCITGLFKYINPVSPPHKKMKVAIILQIYLVGVCMAERRNKVTRIFASTGSIYIISTHLNRPESVSLASLTRQLLYVQILFL